MPSPPKPFRQVHVNEPYVSMHSALSGWQLSVPLAHSSMLRQEDLPSPSKPVLHAQEYEPAVLAQVACR